MDTLAIDEWKKIIIKKLKILGGKEWWIKKTAHRNLKNLTIARGKGKNLERKPNQSYISQA